MYIYRVNLQLRRSSGPPHTQNEGASLHRTRHSLYAHNSAKLSHT